MGTLTDDMTRLRGEVDALRDARGALMRDLTRGARGLAATVSAMRADFTSAHAAMAKQTRRERGSFVAVVIDEVNSLLDAFSRDRNDMARKGRDDRGAFLSEMRTAVTGLCKDAADDLMGARIAWRGERPGMSRPVAVKKEPLFVKPISFPKEAARKKTVAAPEIRAKKPSVIFKEPLKKEAGKKTVAAHEAPAVKTPKVKALPTVSASKPWYRERKEKTMTRAKRGRT